MSQLTNFLSLKLVKLQILNINSEKMEAMPNTPFSLLAGSAPLASFSPAHTEVPAWHEAVNYHSSLRSQLRYHFL